MIARARALARVAIEGLISRRARFDALSSFAQTHLRLESDNFTLDGFDVAPGQRRKPLVMSFKKPGEIIGNHLAKHQAMRLARMIVAYDFDRQLNPFVELGGFLFTFMGDGAPGTGKTILIQMLAGMINDYCEVAGYPFHYENFGVDQISSYQGKSGQNCKEFVDNVLNPRAIGFGTIDDIDQVAAKRSDDRASAGPAGSDRGADGSLRRRLDRGARQLQFRHVLQLSGKRRRCAETARRRALAGRRTAIARGLHRHLRAAGGQEPFDPAGIARPLRRPGNQAGSGAILRRPFDRPQEEGLLAVWERFESEHGEVRTIADIGAYLHRIKLAEPRFTGRAIKNITDAIKMRAMDIDLPDEWFETPEAFMHKSYDEKVAMIGAAQARSPSRWCCRRSTATPIPSSVTPTAPTPPRSMTSSATSGSASGQSARSRR
jgi:hypothetical protein